MAANKNKSLFSNLAQEVSAKEEKAETPVPERVRPSNYLQERSNKLSQLSRGDKEEKTLLWVTPEQCKLWSHHNRRYDLLNEDRCADLIESFKAQGKQEFPAIVRRVEGDPNHDYEVICGARRHWTVSHLRSQNYTNFKFLIEVRDLSDEEAFRLSDVENRDKEDISDYERAMDYQNALTQFYKTQKQMAQRLEVTETWLSRYLNLAELPNEVVEAYPDVTHIKLRHAAELGPLLRAPKTRKNIVETAKSIVADQVKRKGEGVPPIEGAKVVKLLKAAATAKKSAAKKDLIEFRGKDNDKPFLTVENKGRAGVVMKLSPNLTTKQEALKAAKEAIEGLFS